MARWSFSRLVADDAASDFHLFPEPEAILADPGLATGKASVLASMDLGHVDRGLAGVVVPWLALPPSVCVVDLVRGALGRFRFDAYPDGRDAGSLDGLLRTIEGETGMRLRDAAAQLERDFGIPVGSPARPEPSREYRYCEEGVGWCHGPEVFWAQSRDRASYGVPAPDWLYAGMIESDFTPGVHFAFYERASGRLRLIVEIT